VGIVFGVARLEPRSNSASAGAKPGGIEAPETIPSSLGVLRGGDSFRSRSVKCHCEAEPRQSDPKGRCEPEGRGNLRTKFMRLLRRFRSSQRLPSEKRGQSHFLATDKSGV
jgi:hypothetical protein